MSLFGNRLKHVTCRVWSSTGNAFTFPEVSSDNHERQDLLARQNTGVCLSGGGTRSACCSIGQLRGLHALGLLRKTRYLSCVSGGSWAAVPFTYLPGDWNDETLLGMVTAPENLSEDHLKDLDRNSFLYAVADSVIIDDFLKNAARFAGDETYARALGDIFLNRFGLDSLKRFFGFNASTLDSTLARNPDARRSDFYTVRSGRPYLIVGGTILRFSNPVELPDKIQIEMTPMYTGVIPVHTGAGSGGQNIGGGFIESFAFDSDAPEKKPNAKGEVSVRLGASRHRFTLSDVIGTSAAPATETLDRLGLDWVGFPEFKYWPIEKAPAKSLKAREYEFGDGGTLENLGVMPMLLRKVGRMVIFVNTKHRLNGPDDINDSIPPLFGLRFPTNQVFPEDRYVPLVDALMARKATGETVMHRETYPVRDNAHYGVEGGWEVDVLWVYNERVSAWEQKLPQSIRSMIGTGSLGNFPHYKTFFQNPPAIIDLSAKQASLLAHLSCWNVLENADEFRDFL